VKKWMPVIALCVVAFGLLVSSTLLVWRNGAVRRELDAAQTLLAEIALAEHIAQGNAPLSDEWEQGAQEPTEPILDAIVEQLLTDAPDILARIFGEEVVMGDAELFIRLPNNRIIVYGQWHCDYFDETHTIEAIFQYRFRDWAEAWYFELLNYSPYFPWGDVVFPLGWFEGSPIWESPYSFDFLRTHALDQVPMRFYSNGGDWDDFWYLEVELDGVDFANELARYALLHLNRHIIDAWMVGRVLYVNLHRSEPMRMSSGTFGEAMMHATLVSSLASVPGVDVVVIAVNGRREAFFGGHGAAFRDMYLVDDPGVRLDAQRLPDGHGTPLSHDPHDEIDVRIADLPNGLQLRLMQTLFTYGISGNMRQDGFARAWLLDFNNVGIMDLIETVRHDYGSEVMFTVTAANGRNVFQGHERPLSTGPFTFGIAIAEDGTQMLHGQSWHTHSRSDVFYRLEGRQFVAVLTRAVQHNTVLNGESYFYINDERVTEALFNAAPGDLLGVVSFASIDEVAIPIIVPATMADVAPAVFDDGLPGLSVIGLGGMIHVLLDNGADLPQWHLRGGGWQVPSLEGEVINGSAQLTDNLLRVYFSVGRNELILELIEKPLGTIAGPSVLFTYNIETGCVEERVLVRFDIGEAHPPLEFYFSEADVAVMADILLRAKELVEAYQGR